MTRKTVLVAAGVIAVATAAAAVAVTAVKGGRLLEEATAECPG